MDNILKEKIIEECCNDFHNLRVYVSFNPNGNYFAILAYQDVSFTKNEITHWITVISSIDVSLEVVKKDIENVVKQIHYEIEKAKYRELERWVNGFDRGTGMVTGASPEEKICPFNSDNEVIEYCVEGPCEHLKECPYETRMKGVNK